jgi:UDP-N-acetylmuramate dehydrogenase
MTMTATPQNLTTPEWINDLPRVRGTYKYEFNMGDICWFRVGGPADVVFLPADEADLASFLAKLPADIPVHIIGAGSNTLVRDGGVRGVVVRLTSSLSQIQQTGDTMLKAGAGALDIRLSHTALDAGLSGLEFYRGIPGAIGGAVAMNAGAYGGETAERLVRVEGLSRDGKRVVLTTDELGLAYRHNGYDDFIVYTAAHFEAVVGDKETIRAAMLEISSKRETSQPIKSRTGGSTFKNPEGLKSWQLIDQAGCRGARVGGAQVSELHCNFLINHGTATADDLETLGDMVRDKVRQNSGVELQWEIRRIGEKKEADNA